MRLICPNCGAQYEIDAALLPEAGRDVQCSACGHTWFQRPDTAEDEFLGEMGITDADELETAPPPPQPQPPEPPQPRPPQPATPRRSRRPDETALAILREEAEREAEARRREAAAVETQGEFSLPESPRRRHDRDADADRGAAALAATRAAAATPEPDPQPRPARAAAESRRDVFPDIEEINSSLSVGDIDREAPEPAEATETRSSRRRGFRVGFLTVVIFFGVLIALYAFAPRLADMFPSARPFLADYVDWANAKRLQIDGVMQAATSRIGGS